MSDKKYCGTAKIDPDGRFGPETELLIFEQDMRTLCDAWREVKDDEKPCIKVRIQPKKTPKSAWTHYGIIAEKKQQEQEQGGVGNVPF